MTVKTHGPTQAQAATKCAAVEAVENGIGIAREQGITDPTATLYVVLGHVRSRFPDVTAVIRRIAEGK